MQWMTHSTLADRHAFLSASNYHWLNYTPDKLESRWMTHQAAVRGTKLHALAHDAIKLGIKFAGPRQSLSRYVNDAIGFRMQTEQVLYYSDNCFGTADTISFRKNLLRIHDLKTGISKVSMNQLIIYAALFCLEYGVSPYDITTELRIYQNDEVEAYIPEPEEIKIVMNKIIEFDGLVSMFRSQQEI